ncbi:GntR family transcriptional regulator [Oceanobacillus caeni]|uniref:GntR family transcriptional regulator n=1 Tax=Oceanobacillus caeni TaxID=405946 RepID=A0ABR5MHQ3_9BACI|nr:MULTISPECIES: GntR family transcriptional regulator [Bacillaceae]KKE80096.1 GntR family transcriptional regulator [Bacilli bacterium VT-13-104]PZD85963.1 GntR family transcriptional regulator [Bacilli bacterium]KPH73523.1 GntR family transcriptional regulator [Oceanobacillus caeni]MBU8790508.1 GntR family transcriptional regulator [Oceanobacillus caeni]MCR1835281.1 GntR family transcriptional regulator [Oceanobacillus caeni]
MRKTFNQDKPIYLQVREQIEDQILKHQLKEGEQAPSTNQLVNFYKINHVTVSKGVNQLVDEGILYKKRGIGMFVAEGAREMLIQKRKESFMEDYVVKLVHEANKLEITENEIIQFIKNVKEREAE